MYRSSYLSTWKQVVFVGALLLLCSSFRGKSSQVAFHFFTEEGGKVDVQANFKGDDMLVGYQANIFTPVCGGGSCMPVEIILHWDVLGRYTHYELLPNTPLTKVNHQEFDKKDYQLLTEILGNENSILKDLSPEDLVQEATEVDATSGATNTEVKAEVVEGAVFSCYTLWHIAHGEVRQIALNYTKTHLSPKMVDRIAKTDDHDAIRDLVSIFDEADFVRYQDAVLQMMRCNDVFVAEDVVHKTPTKLYDNKLFQDDIAPIYAELGYNAQSAVLDDLRLRLNSSELATALIDALAHQDELQTQKIVRLYCQSPTAFTKRLNRHFVKTIVTLEIAVAPEYMERLKDWAGGDKKLLSALADLSS